MTRSDSNSLFSSFAIKGEQVTTICRKSFSLAMVVTDVRVILIQGKAKKPKGKKTTQETT